MAHACLLVTRRDSMTFKPEGKNGVFLPDGTYEEQPFTDEDLAEMKAWNDKFPQKFY
ncbi:MAG: hypothetical protein CM15mV119_210 [uncultured marine virus]|nr:MAG: hypothetical protein CM15mV119_210 [uncultured marine virus]